MRKHRGLWLTLPLAVLLGAPAPAAEAVRFQARGHWAAGPVEWVTFYGSRGVLGSGTEITLIDRDEPPREVGRRSLPWPAVDGLLVGGRLYVVDRADGVDGLAVVDLERPGSVPASVALQPAARGALRLAQMDDYLLVAEDGFGLRALALPAHHGGHGAQAHEPPSPRAVGALPLARRFTAIAASLRTVYLAAPGELFVVDASVPGAPRLVRSQALHAPTHALAANARTLYALGPDGLQVLDVDAGGAATATYPEVSGSSIRLAGRTLYVAAGDRGLVSFEDTSAAQATIFIQVGDLFFNPAGAVSVNQGDTVVWQKPGTIFPHNVFSCNGVQAGCGGQSATEAFSSGAATTGAFNFQHTFNVVGSNPYVCQVHNTTMQGDIQVSAAAVPPPRVADGTNATTPMTVTKLDAAATGLRIFYDAGACGSDADDHNILFGTGAALPAALGGTYAPGGARCSIGTVSPFQWLVSPAAPPPGDFLWWLVVADDGAGTEGSWSDDSAGGERDGAGANGSSNLCGNADKDLTNTCPP